MRVLFISSGNTDFPKIPFIESQEKSLIDNGIDVDHFLIYGKGLKGYLKNIPLLRKHIEDNNFDLIHAHYSFCGWVALLTGTKLPVVVSYMGSDVYGLVDIHGRKKLKGYLEIFIAKSLQPFVKKIIVKSRNLEDYIFIKNKAAIIPNGVDFKKYKPRNKHKARVSLNILTEKKVILFLGSKTNPRKNFKLCKDAFDLINNDQWTLVSPFPVPAKQTADYLNAADVLVVTSFLEGSPNVIKEAMASNCPIVATDVGDIKEVINKTEGCYLTSFNVYDVAAKIKNAIVFNDTTTGRTDIHHLELNRIAIKIIELYGSLL